MKEGRKNSMDGWIDGWIDVLMEYMNRWVGGLYVCMYGWMKWNVYGLVGGCINVLNECMDGIMD